MEAALKLFEAQFEQFQANIREEIVQAKGLGSDQDADKFAKAASGIMPEKSP